MEPTTRPLADILERIVALLEAISYQTSGRTQEIGPYLSGVYRQHADRNPEAAHDGEEHT